MNSSKIENKSGWLVGGGIVASIIASLCCIGPLILTVLGVSGAAALAKFDVIRIPMIILVITIFLLDWFGCCIVRDNIPSMDSPILLDH